MSLQVTNPQRRFFAKRTVQSAAELMQLPEAERRQLVQYQPDWLRHAWFLDLRQCYQQTDSAAQRAEMEDFATTLLKMTYNPIHLAHQTAFTFDGTAAWQQAVSDELAKLPIKLRQDVAAAELDLDRLGAYLRRSLLRYFSLDYADQRLTWEILNQHAELDDISLARIKQAGHMMLHEQAAQTIKRDLNRLIAARTVITQELAAPAATPDAHLAMTLAEVFSSVHDYAHLGRGDHGLNESRLNWQAVQADWYAWHRYRDETAEGIPAGLRHGYDQTVNAISQVGDALSLNEADVARLIERIAVDVSAAAVV